MYKPVKAFQGTKREINSFIFIFKTHTFFKVTSRCETTVKEFFLSKSKNKNNE